MLVHRAFVSSLATIVAASVVGGLPGPASADVTVPAAGSALDLPAGVSLALTGSSALSTTAFNDFPSRGSDYLVLSSGDAGAVFAGNPALQLSTDVGGDGLPDTASVTLTVAQGTKVGSTATNAGCLFVDFALGTDERVHTYVQALPSDRLSITRAEDPDTQYATNAGKQYFSQSSSPADPKPYEVNAIDYWHQPGNPTDPLHGTVEEPRLDRVTALDHVTTRDTARIPLDVSADGETITISVADVGNGDLDSAAFLDNVRLGASCASGTGVAPLTTGIIAGKRQVGSVLTYDPDPATPVVEKYDATDNGWQSPSSGVPVDLRFRWYRATSTNAYNGDMTKWTAIQDADRQSYVPTNLDKDKVLIVLVTGVVDGRRPETYPSTSNAANWYVTTQIQDGQFDAPSQLPSIDGPVVPRVNDTLTAHVGNAVPRQDDWEFQWFTRNPNGSSTLAIAGQTGVSLVLSSGQVGKQILVRATAKRSGFLSQSWTSGATATVELIPLTWPGSPAVPTVDATGDLLPGVALTAYPGPGWPEQVTEWTYQWSAGGAPVGTGQNYTVRPADAGKTVTVTVRGAPSGYAPLLATSEPLAIGAEPLTATPAPTISGNPTVGHTVSAEVAAWEPAPVPLTFEWRRDGVAIIGATSASYTLQLADAGSQLTVAVTSNRLGYARVTQTSPAVTVLGAVMKGATPTVAGTAKVGSKLTGTVLAWEPSRSSLTYGWYADGVLLQSGTSRYYTIGPAAVGKQVVLRVTGTKVGHQTLSVDSAPTAVVARGTITMGTVRLYGTARVGSTLRASPGSWQPSPVTLQYRWRIGSKYVTGAAGARNYLKIPSSARGKRISLVVVGRKTGFTTAQRTSSSTSVVR